MDPGMIGVLAFSIPILAAIFAYPLGNVSKKGVGWFSTIIAFISAALVFMLIPEVLEKGKVIFTLEFSEKFAALVPMIAQPFIGMKFALYIDSLSLLIAGIASGFGTLDLLYAVADMEREEHLGRFYAVMLIFIGSMTGLAFAGDLILLFVFWELVGICSYLLTGFHYEKPDHLRASYKAIMLTHGTGLALLVGIIWTYLAAGTLLFEELPRKLIYCKDVAVIIAVLFLVAAIAKSVQFPLHTWLPDATVAPSPATALLHAAAMVKAGIYLVARMYFLFGEVLGKSLLWQLTVSTIGVITMTVAVMCALAQKDIERLLAYHTISQIGYMFLGVGIGTALGVAAGLFYLLNHAIFKGLLSLCAGCLIYATGTRYLDEMGGLAKNMPVTAVACIFAAFSVSGIPPFNGFVSKLMIYEAALGRGIELGGLAGSLFIVYAVIAMFVSAATLASFMKLLYSAFFGSRPEKLKEVKEVPLPMQVSITILAFLCLFFGVVPQVPLRLIIPASVALVGGEVHVTWLGFVETTMLGGYFATLVTGLIVASIILGLAIYRIGLAPRTPAEVEIDVFTGGEIEQPYLDINRVRPDPEAFLFGSEVMFEKLYKFMKRGGLDILWFGIGKLVVKASEKLRKVQIGYLNVYTIVLAAFLAIILAILFL